MLTEEEADSARVDSFQYSRASAACDECIRREAKYGLKHVTLQAAIAVLALRLLDCGEAAGGKLVTNCRWSFTAKFMIKEKRK
ncbi:hypothetical protein ACFFSY_28945 [Paenibacillus aurantiacus]|uniref:Uncharacterized protein n=1 Tax=Paenibacillus aurantiacus TaxID=1936118 RepID=A0ABV5L0J2_9BACL